MSKYRVFLVRIFSYLDWIRRFTRENTDQKNFVLGQFIRYFLHYEQNFRWDQIKWRAWCYYRIDQVIRGILNTLKIANKELHFRKINIYVIIHIDTKRSFRYCLNTMYCLTKTTPPPPLPPSVITVIDFLLLVHLGKLIYMRVLMCTSWQSHYGADREDMLHCIRQDIYITQYIIFMFPMLTGAHILHLFWIP